MVRFRAAAVSLFVLLPLIASAQLKTKALVAAPCQEGPISPDESNDATFRTTCGGDLHDFHGRTTPISVAVPITRVVGDNLQALQSAGMINATATVKISAIGHGVDLGFGGSPTSPVHVVKLNGHQVGFLHAAEGSWTLNTFHVPVEWLNFPVNYDPNAPPTPSLNQIEVDVDTQPNAETIWSVKVDWAETSVIVARPILLVHGILSSGKTWFPLWFNQLNLAHVPFWAVSLPDIGTKDIEHNSAFIATTIETLKKQWGVDKINIVAHSKGGLDSRDYIEFHDDVERLVQIGSPNAGSPLADAIHHLTKAIPGLQKLINHLAPIEYVLTTKYMKEYNASHSYNPNVRYTAIAGIWHPGWFDHSLKRLLTFIVGKGDTVVPRWSVHSLPYTQDIKFETYGNDGATHTKLTSQTFIYSMTASLLGLPKPVLPIFPPPHIGPFDDDSDGSLELPGIRKLGTRGGKLHAGETTVETVTVDESQPVAFSMVFPSTDDVSMAVISPSGVRWDKNSTYPEDAGYEVGDFGGQPMVTISFDHPEIGEWQVKVSANAVDVYADDQAARPGVSALSLTPKKQDVLPETNYFLQFFVQEPTTQLDVAFERESVHVGESFRIKGTLTRNGLPLTGVSVTARAALPDGTILPLTLHDDGQAGDQTPNDGVYTADFPANAGGEYDVQVTAKEIRPAAIAFSREEAVSGAASTSTTHLQSPFSDTAFRTNPNHGSLDVLAVTGAMNIDAPGHYHVLATLRDASGGVVATASRTLDSGGAGTFPMTFSFPGPSIYLSQKNGPYHFGVHVTEDLNDILAVTQDEQDLYSTTAYNWFVFTPPDEGARTDTDIAPSNVTAQYGGTTDVTARLTADALPLSGRSLTFIGAGAFLGTATTDTNGVATIHNVTVPPYSSGAQTMTVRYDGDITYNPGSGASSFYITPGTQTITWNTPADITPGTPLGSAQLNAVVHGSGFAPGGELTYDPPEGTVLELGDHQALTVTAQGSSFYPEATATVYINVRNPPAPVTWSDPADIVYGTPLTSVQLNATSSTQGTFTYSPAANTILNAGSSQALNVTFTPWSASFSPATRTVHINVLKATPSIQWATPAAVVFGTPLSATQLNATSSINAALSYAPPAGTVLNAGHQTLTASTAATQNYNAATVSVTIDVAKATPSVSWSNPADIVYGTSLSSTQLNATASVAGTFAYTPAAGAILNAGSNQTLSVVFTPNDANYETRSATVHINIVKATPSISWSNPAGIVYGTALSATQLNATAAVAGTFAYAPPAGTILTAGTHTLTVAFTPNDTANYNTASATVSLTVLKATPPITWSTPANITYGAALGATQLNASSSVAGTFTYTPAAGTVLTAGTQTLTASFTPTDTANYNAATATVSLTVLKATPTITWSTPANITYGTPLGATQLNASSSVSGTFNYTPAAGTVLTAGTQTLTATFTPTDSANYNTASGTVSLTVLKATPSVTWSTPASIIYGTALGATQLNASASVGGTFTYTPAAGTILGGGDSTLSVSFSPTDSANYNTASATVIQHVARAAQTITWATPPPIATGSAISSAQLNATVSVSGPAAAGALTYDVASGTVLSAGDHTVTATAAATANYDSAQRSVVFHVCDFPVITAQPQGTVIAAGGSAHLTLQATNATTIDWYKSDGTFVASGSPLVSISTTTTYYAIVTNSCASVRSANVTITVCVAPTITAQPASFNIVQGQPATLSIGVAALTSEQIQGGGPLFIQWFNAAGDISLGTGNDLVIYPSATMTVYAKVGNGCGQVRSANATIGVAIPACILPTINSQTPNPTIPDGTSTTLSVDVSSMSPLGYQWYINGTPEGADGGDMTNGPDFDTGILSASSDSDHPGEHSRTYRYYVVVSNSCGSVRSNDFVVTVTGGDDD